MVKNIERFRAEFKGRSLRYSEVLQQRHIKIDEVGILQPVTTRVSKGQTSRDGESCWVVVQRSESFKTRNLANARLRIANDVSVRS